MDMRTVLPSKIEVREIKQEKMTSTFESTLKSDRRKLKSLDATYLHFIESVKGYNPNIEEDLELIYKILKKSRINATALRFKNLVEILEYMSQHI